MKCLVSPRNWTATACDSTTIRLQNQRPAKSQWYRINVRWSRSATSEMVHQTISLHRGLTPEGTVLLPSQNKSKWELVFSSAELLQTLHLKLSHDAITDDLLEIEVLPLPIWRAIALMLQSVSNKDSAAGRDASRIYRKSWARRRRLGWDGFLLRLLREYQPQELTSLLVGDPYHTWIETNEAPTPCSVDSFPLQPLLAVVMTNTGTSESLLRQSIDSILQQSYPNLEVLIFNNAASAAQVQQLFRRYAGDDSRLHLISAAGDARQILLQSRGEYFALLDPGDRLAKGALSHLVRVIGENPDAAIFYSDEDRIDRTGRRFAPNFKPDWNPDLFFSQSYLSRLCLYKREILTAATGIECFRDDALLLHSLPHLKAEQIVHIPKILYHRHSSGSEREEGSPTSQERISSLQSYLTTRGQRDVVVEAGLAPGLCRVRYPIPQPAPLVSLLIPTRDRRELIETCVQSILTKTTYQNYEILILDNQSQDVETREFLKKIEQNEPRVRVLRYDQPFNYSAINNFGFDHAQGEIIGLINNDMEIISPDWLGEMVSHACRPEIGCVGAKLYYPDGSIQHAGVILGLWGVAGHSHKHLPRSAPGYGNRLLAVQNYSAVTGACLLVRRDIYQNLGGLNEKDLPVAFNDVDFCLRVRAAGYRNLWTPYAELYHHESVSRGTDLTPEQIARGQREIDYMKKNWAAELVSDPSYSPHLTHQMENFSINLDHIFYPAPAKDELTDFARQIEPSELSPGGSA